MKAADLTDLQDELQRVTDALLASVADLQELVTAARRERQGELDREDDQ